MILPPILIERSADGFHSKQHEFPIGANGDFNAPRVGDDIILKGTTFAVRMVVWDCDAGVTKIFVDRIS